MGKMSEASIGMKAILAQGMKMVNAARETLDETEELIRMLASAAGMSVGNMGPPEEVLIEEEDNSAEDVSAAETEKPAEDAEEKPEEEPAGTETEPAAVKRTATLEETRAVLAAKSRNGYRAEVKALLTKYGAEKLSDITDAAVLGAMMTEAEGLGCQNTPT